jgi:hypothetical protein
MPELHQALAAAARPHPSAPLAARRALVVGGGGSLGSAVLEQLLGTQRFERVGALVTRELGTALRGFVAVADDDAALAAFGADTALVVFDRPRHAFGREAAFVRVSPAALADVARRLHGAGVRRLIVAVPHAPSLLPAALQLGLASLDEAAVAGLGFDQLVFMRLAQADRSAAGPRPAQWLARWMLSQLRWMIPQREQPVRAETVARVAAALALQLPLAGHATRVLPAQVLWQAAQQRDAGAAIQAWLARPGAPG